MLPFVIGVFGTVPIGLERELEELEIGERIETIQITELLRAVRILRGVLKTRRN